MSVNDLWIANLRAWLEGLDGKEDPDYYPPPTIPGIRAALEVLDEYAARLVRQADLVAELEVKVRPLLAEVVELRETKGRHLALIAKALARDALSRGARRVPPAPRGDDRRDRDAARRGRAPARRAQRGALRGRRVDGPDRKERPAMTCTHEQTPDPCPLCLLEASVVEIDYTNYKGDRRPRLIRPKALRFAETPHHTPAQLVLDAHDVEKNAPRTFALAQIHSWRLTRSRAAVDTMIAIAGPTAASRGAALRRLEAGSAHATNALIVEKGCAASFFHTLPALGSRQTKCGLRYDENDPNRPVVWSDSSGKPPHGDGRRPCPSCDAGMAWPERP